MHNFLDNQTGRLPFKMVILGLIIITVVVTSGVLLIRKINSPKNQLVAFGIPANYTEPLIITAFNNIFSIQPVNANNSNKIVETRFIASQDREVIKYIDAYSSTDVEQTQYTDKLKEDIVLKQAGHPEKFEYIINNLDEYDYIMDNQGNLNFYKKEILTGFSQDPSKEGLNGFSQDSGQLEVPQKLKKIFTIPTPFMIEDNVETRHCLVSEPDCEGVDKGKVQMEIQGDRLILTPDPEWIASHNYPIIIDPTLEINILNLYSHPQQGENWEVSFTTLGQADLKIIPNDQDTINDDEFVSLSCDGQILNPQILPGDVIYYPNWVCAGIAKVVHYTLVAGKHTLRFEFGPVKSPGGDHGASPDDSDNLLIAYAHNDPDEANDPWFGAWGYRRSITIDNSGQATTFANFPVAVILNETTTTVHTQNIDYSKTQNAGQDIRFVNYDGAELDYEIEKWDETATSTVWVEIPSVEASTSTQYFYMYYGNGAASDGQNMTGTWDSNFVAVHHLQETDIDSGVGDIKDSKALNNGTTANMDATNQVDGKILDGSFSFDGVNERVSMADSASLDVTGDLTIEAWIKADTTFGDRSIVNKSVWIDDWKSYAFYLDSAWCGGREVGFGIIGSDWKEGTTCSNAVIATSTWAYVVGVFDAGATRKTFVNGADETRVLLGDMATNIDNVSNACVIGSFPNVNSWWFDGLIDEVRISNTNRSANWIAAQYKSMTNSFLTYSNEAALADRFNDWDYRTQIIIDNSGQATTFANFPVAVILNETTTTVHSKNISYSRTQNAGQDIRFVNYDGAELDYEIEKWDETATSTVWVEIPSVEASTSTQYFYMYYGNDAAGDGQDMTGTWDSNFVAVHHLEETDIDGGVGDIKDSKALNNGTTANMEAEDQVDGKILDGSFNFDGANENVIITDSATLDVTGDLTIEAWIKPDTTFGDRVIASKTVWNDASKSYQIYLDYIWCGPREIAFHVVAPDPYNEGYTCSNAVIATSTWAYVVGVFDAGVSRKTYINGVDETRLVGGDMAASIQNVATNFAIGSAGGPAYSAWFDGLIDEVRISKTNRSDDWIALQYCMMTNSCLTYMFNSAPRVNQVIDSPDPIGVGANLTFSVGWEDDDEGDMATSIICKGSGIATSTATCKDGEWASYGLFTNRPTSTPVYTTAAGDKGSTHNYWAFVCDDDFACSNGTAGTFTVANQRPDEPAKILIEGREVGNATNITDTTPEFSAVYYDTNDEGDVAEKYCIEVDTQADFAGTDMWISDSASCYSGSAVTSNIIEGTRSESFEYAGTTLSTGGTTYYWRMWFWDGEERSATSTTGWFLMADTSSGGGVRLKGSILKGGIRLK